MSSNPTTASTPVGDKNNSALPHCRNLESIPDSLAPSSLVTNGYQYDSQRFLARPWSDVRDRPEWREGEKDEAYHASTSQFSEFQLLQPSSGPTPVTVTRVRQGGLMGIASDEEATSWEITKSWKDGSYPEISSHETSFQPTHRDCYYRPGEFLVLIDNPRRILTPEDDESANSEDQPRTKLEPTLWEAERVTYVPLGASRRPVWSHESGDGTSRGGQTVAQLKQHYAPMGHHVGGK